MNPATQQLEISAIHLNIRPTCKASACYNFVLLIYKAGMTR